MGFIQKVGALGFHTPKPPGLAIFVIIITGAWSEEEESKLVAAVRELSGDASLSPEASLPPDFSLPPDVSWSQVAEIVGSRNGPQCRSKWFFDLAWKERGGVNKWNCQDDVKLLHLLSSQEASDEDEVEWVELCSGWDSARSPYHLRNKWACLRRSVPSYHNKTFQGESSQLLCTCIWLLQCYSHYLCKYNLYIAATKS